MRCRAPLVVALVLVLPLLSGCLDFLGRGMQDHNVARSPLDQEGWNRDGLFTVQVREPDAVLVKITGTAPDGRTIETVAPSSATLPAVELVVPDGTWTLRYYLDGTKWETFKGLRFDATPPTFTGLATVGDAVGRAYTVGQGATVEAGATVRVIDQATGLVIATALPTTVTGLSDGIHAYDVIVADQAGNQVAEQVQVRVGSAQQLPPGKNTLGLVARYTVSALVWDLTDLGSWSTPEQARAAAGDAWLGSGRGIDPNDAAVKQVVAAQATAGMTTGEAAFAIFRWMADNLEYDHSRLDSNTLLTPRQTLLDSEDPVDDTAEGKGNGDGLARDGAGNGVKGGVCRDLAAVYVSLLRSAGIPARLVTGYLGGGVNGFHAWVEFYGGAGHGPSAWVPVDVSVVGSSETPGEQGYEAGLALQSFGLRHTDMLPLRVVTNAQEQDSWSAAVRVQTNYTKGSQPTVTLAKDLKQEFEVKGVLCVDTARLARELVSGSGVKDCPRQYTAGYPDFKRSNSFVLDYGALVDLATVAAGTTVTLTLAYPDAAAAAPGTVEQVTYGSAFTKDASAGVTTATWTH